MCYETNTKPTTVCQVGDLKPGQKFYDSRNDRLLVMLDDSAGEQADGVSKVCDPDAGTIIPMDNSIKLADRGDGNLYASRTLNGWPGGWVPNLLDEPAIDPNEDIGGYNAFEN